MGVVQAQESRVVDASPEVVHGIIADYRIGHQAILPKEYFASVKVVEGGTGAGTVLDLHMTVMGTDRKARQTVSEPEPGRVLVEKDDLATTTFTFDSEEGGTKTKVTITTEIQSSPGFRGFMERLMTPPVLKRIYREELDLLAEYVRRTK